MLAGRLSEGALVAVRDVAAREGVGGLWRGLGATLWRDVPFSCIYWFSYESLRRRSRVVDPYQEHGLRDTFVAGAAAGAVAATVTTPLDVIKTQQQLSGSPAPRRQVAAARGACALVKAPSALATLAHIVRTDGPRALFSGLLPRLVKVAPSCAIMIGSYEFGKQFFAKHPLQLSFKVFGKQSVHISLKSLCSEQYDGSKCPSTPPKPMANLCGCWATSRCHLLSIACAR